jgi:hypothetical protein
MTLRILTTMLYPIAIRAFSSMPDLAAEGWDPNAVEGDETYQSARAARLYAALEVSPDDDEYTLAEDARGRWALVLEQLDGGRHGRVFGLTVSGHRYAVELHALDELLEEYGLPDLGLEDPPLSTEEMCARFDAVDAPPEVVAWVRRIHRP